MRDRLRSLAVGTILVAVAMLPPGPWVRRCFADGEWIGKNNTGMPDVVCALAGRVREAPLLYHELALKHAAERLRPGEDVLGPFDELAGECDVLGRYEEAIAWRAKKQQRLDAMYAQGREAQAYYEYSCYQHLVDDSHTWFTRWLRNGADRARLDEVRKARDLLREASQKYPHESQSYRGNSPCWSQYLDWIIAGEPFDPRKGTSLPTFIDLVPTSEGAHEITKELCNLITEDNVDIMNALIRAFDAEGRSEMALLAHRRCVELIRNGGISLVAGAPKGEALVALIALPRQMPRDPARIDTIFRHLRAEADALCAYHVRYMLKRLRRGEFPECMFRHDAFWATYDEPEPSPALVREARFVEYGIEGELRASDATEVMRRALGEQLPGVAIVLAGIVLLYRLRRGRELRRATAPGPIG